MYSSCVCQSKLALKICLVFILVGFDSLGNYKLNTLNISLSSGSLPWLRFLWQNSNYEMNSERKLSLVGSRAGVAIIKVAARLSQLQI